MSRNSQAQKDDLPPFTVIIIGAGIIAAITLIGAGILVVMAAL